MLCLDENTMIENVIKNFQDAGVEEIVVVTGYKSEVLQRHLSDKGVKTIENVQFANTKMFDSLCLGLRVLEGPYDAALLTPGDVPLVQPETIKKLLKAQASVVRPVYRGEPGHPVLLAAELVPKVLNNVGTDGLRGVLESLEEPILDVEVNDAGITMDADTPEDFKNLRRQKMENRSGGELWPDIHIHIAKGDTILTPETAQFLEMIGHTGSIQGACSCMHMSYTRGWRMLNRMEKDLGYPLIERFPGGVSGGGSVMTAKGKRLLAAYQTYRDTLRQTAEQLFYEVFDDDLRG